ncbi:MAG: flagellar hook-associated protein FlgK [Ignavibacteriae bacterium HGW-Ignavibacteriae-3]|nr:MAG: flagellar hook-associated protein FlgK [Ignavibacteriae bacterium HGW-Ignavibacteriae-3]
MRIGTIFDVAVRAMSTYKQAIDVTSNNISNAGNKDYSRQRAQFGTVTAENGRGAGVRLADVQRIKDDLLGVQIRNYNSKSSDANKRAEILSQIEAIVAEPSDVGLANYLTEFFNSWDKLSAQPNSTSLRLNVIQKAQSVSDRFEQMLTGLNDIQTSLQREAHNDVDAINSYLRDINDYNKKISESELRNIKANELKDQRDAVIDKLSKIVNVSVQNNPNGSVTVNVGGLFGADVSSVNEFDIKIINSQLRLVSKSDTNSIAYMNSGSLFAVSDMYSNTINKYKTNLESLESSFVNNINAVHMSGNTLINGASSSTGVPFFGERDLNGNVINAISGGQLRINPAILTNPSNIAASSLANNDGNGMNANSIARLMETRIPELSDKTFLDYYNMTMNGLGLDKVSADNAIQSSDAILLQLENQKTSTSGVSLDEEMTNVLQFQRCYDAASKMVKVADEMMQTILQMV